MGLVHHNGIAIDLLDQGEVAPHGLPFLLLHSAGMGAGQWRNLISQMSDSDRLIAPNQRGYGRSEKWPAGVQTDLEAERGFLESVLDYVGGPVHLIGHSMGAFLALELARRTPNRFPTLTLIEPVSLGVLRSEAGAPALAEVERMIDGFCKACEAGNVDGAMQIFTDYWYGDGAWEKIPKAQRLPIFARAEKMHQDVRAIRADVTPGDVYRNLKIPVLILTGERTTGAARKMAELIGENLTNVRQAVLPTAGHMAPVTHADLIAEHVLNHVQQSEAA